MFNHLDSSPAGRQRRPAWRFDSVVNLDRDPSLRAQIRPNKNVPRVDFRRMELHANWLS
jgi:hypothetical protein